MRAKLLLSCVLAMAGVSPAFAQAANDIDLSLNTVQAPTTGGVDVPNEYLCNQAAMVPFGNTFNSPSATRGYWFEAPVDFTICTVEVPNETAQNVQNVEIVRFNNGAPPVFSSTTNAFVSLFKAINAAPGPISTQIRVRRGDFIGVLGACGTTTMANSYGTPAGPYVTTLLGCPVTYTRMGMQFNLNSTGAAQDLWQEPGFQVSRVLLGVRAGPMAACPSELPDFSSTFGFSFTRGYYFTAPKDMTITGLRVPNEGGQPIQNVEIVRFNAGAPPAFPATTNAFVSLGRFVNVANDNIITTYANVKQGDVIGILGARGTTTQYNSYSAAANNLPATIAGESVVLNRMGMQDNLNATAAHDLWTEANNPIARVEIFTGTTETGKALLIDGDTTGTGSTLGGGPWNTPKGVVTFSGEFRLANSDNDFLAVGAFGNGFDILGTAPGNSPAEINFGTDVDSVTFIYGGNFGSIQVDALTAGNVVVDTFFQADTDVAPAGPQTLSGANIRKIRWNDTNGTYCIIDNVAIKYEEAPCYADCDMSGNLDFFDFLCFQNAFAAGLKYADCDGSGNLDFFDFLCFQNEFAAGCP